MSWHSTRVQSSSLSSPPRGKERGFWTSVERQLVKTFFWTYSTLYSSAAEVSQRRETVGQKQVTARYYNTNWLGTYSVHFSRSADISRPFLPEWFVSSLFHWWFLVAAVMEAIPTIVCDTLYAMGLHDQVSLTNAVFTFHFLIPTNKQYSEPVDDKERWRICSSPLRVVDALQAN